MLKRFSLRPIFRHRSLCGLLVLLVLLVSLSAETAAPEVVSRFSQRHWHRADGLPSNEVTGLCQDRTGYLWVATSNGLVRFDGTRFLGYDFAPGGQLMSSSIAAIAADLTDDSVWVAPSAGGLVRFRSGRFEEHPLLGAYSQRRVATLFVAADGALWIGFEGGDVMRVHGDRFETFGVEDGLGPLRATQFASDGAGRVWLANGPLLVWYESGALHPLLLPGLNENLRIASARKDGPWLLSRGWLHKVVGGQLAVKIEVNSSFNAYSVHELLEDSQGAIWTGTRARGVRRLTLPEERSDLIITDPEDVGVLCEDRAGNIWAGSNGGGLVRVRAGVVRYFDKSQGLLESHTLSVCQDNAGTVWIANRDGGVAFVNAQGRINTLASPKVRDTFIARSVVPVGPSGVLAGTSHGLLRAEKSGLLAADAASSPLQPPDHGQLRVTHMSREGDLWMALAPGRLGRLKDGNWRVFAAADGLGTGAFKAIAEDAEGRIWIGTEEGHLYRFDGGRFAPVQLTAPAGAGAIQALHFDNAGVCWIGTAGAGLMRLGPPDGRHLAEPHGLPTSNITQVISDDHGALWCGSPEGIFHVRRDELEEFFAGRIAWVDTVVLGADEGLNEATCTSAHQPSVWKSRDGLLWFATRQGVVAIDPRRELATATPLAVRIDAVRADGLRVGDAGPVRISARVRTVELDYSVLCLSTPVRVRARVRLQGYDDEWMPADDRGSARYSRLPPGQYQFVVEAHVAGASGTSASVCVPVVVVAAWWQTIWFRAGVVLLVLMLGALVVRAWSHRRLRRRLEQLEQSSVLERERARIAQNIHDDLGSGLTRISLLTQSAAVNDGRAQLDKIYNTVSELTQSMDEIVWAVNPKHDDLEGLANYLVEFAQGFLQDAGIRCRVLLPEFLPAATLTTQSRHHLFMGCKEALNNIAKHAQASEVSLQLSVAGTRLVIVITDNGHGFVVPVMAPDSTRAGTGNGLANMHARLAALGGTCEISSSPAGTMVTFTAPLSDTPATSL